MAAHPEPDAIFSLTERPGHLRLYGRETIGSLFTQALVARRQQDFCYSASCALDFASPSISSRPRGWSRIITAAKFHYLHVSHDEEIGRHLRVMSALPDSAPRPTPSPRRSRSPKAGSSFASKWITRASASPGG
jgi:xylan 1,4-beta-xylosidase